jgi:hypothetical protein
VALFAFAELAEKAGEKLSQWIADTFIFTDAQKELNNQLVADNKTIADYSAKADALAKAYELIGKTGSQATDIKLGWNSDEILKTEAAMRAVQDNMYGMRDAGEGTSVAYGKLADQLGVMQAKLKELQQENQNLAKTYQAEAAKEAEEAAKKRLEIEKKVDEEILKARRELEKDLEKEAEDNSKLLDERLKTELEGEEKIAEATLKEGDAELKLSAAMAKTAAERQADLVAADKAQGLTSKEQADRAVLVGLLEKQKDAELAIVDAKIAEAQADMQVAFKSGGTDSADFLNAEAQYKEYQAQRVEIAANADKQIQQANDNTYKEENKVMQAYLTQFNSQFASAFAEVVTGHETVAKAAQKMFTSLETMAAQDLAKFALSYAEKSAIAALFHTQQASQAAAAAAATKASTTPINVSEAISNSAVAATSAAAAAGPLAPAAAAATYAAMAPFISLAAYDTGGMVDTTQMALVHGGEAVLTPAQTENLKDAADNVGGGTTHNHNWNISAMDGKSTAQFFKSNLDVFGDAMESAVAKGHASLSTMARGK